MIKRELTEEEAFEKRESGKHKNRNRVLELAGKSLGILGELLRSDFHSVIPGQIALYGVRVTLPGSKPV